MPSIVRVSEKESEIGVQVVVEGCSLADSSCACRNSLS